MLFSPILMVRILDPTSFGQYREFMAYAMLATSLAAFSVPSNLLYFIPHHRDKTPQYVSHTNLLSLALSIFACVVIWLLRDFIEAKTSFSFVAPLCIYVLLYCNLNFLESYFLANKNARNVFYLSTIRTTVRLTAVIGTAFHTRSVDAILNALILVELLRIVVVAILSLRIGLIFIKPDKAVLKQQLGFIVPLGIASSLNFVDQYIGQILISAHLGVVALAIYAVASFKVPVIRIIRSAVSDAIFPDMVREAISEKDDKLRLWKRGNVAYSVLIFPIFTVLFWYADIIIPFVFTDEYAEAVPIFRILLLLMPIQCIELSSPLRAANRTGALLTGNLLMLGSNLACIFIFFRYIPHLAIFGPAIGTIVGNIVQRIYMGTKIIQFFEIRLRDMLKWRSQAIIVSSVSVCALVLVVGEYAVIPDFIRIVGFSLLYAAAYFIVLRRYRLEEVETIFEVFARKLRRRAT